jgi:2-(3-amino-3-carboxypropyl)histidine synthase
MEKEEIQIFSKTSKTKIINIIEKENYKDLEENVLLTIALEKLPKNYNFEIYKSIKKIREISKEKKKKNPLIALQFPEGLLIFSLLISDILSTFAECETIILGDITYGACCIDDIGCSLLNCDLIIHYAHSCLKPNIITLVKVMYIFVEIKIDIEHLVKTIILNFPKENSDSLFFLGSLQYNSSLFVLKRKLIDYGYDKNNIIIPQNKPRVIGEVIGCTSPILEKKKDNCYVIFICDGRFHMESVMIQNPNFKFFQYNPFTKYLTIEEYDIDLMKKIRFEQIEKLKESKFIGVIFGTLGRQGSKGILDRINKLLDENNKDYVNICLNEITEEKISKFPQCDCFIQIACPRLSIDWPDQFSKPMLTPYETYIAFGKIEKPEIYRMDNYSYETGEWGHLYKEK